MARKRGRRQGVNKHRNIYRKDIKWERVYTPQGHRRAPVGGWEKATIGHSVDMLTGPPVRCLIDPKHGIKTSWEAREYSILYAITEAILAAEFRVKRARPKVTRPARHLRP